ncbi:DUF7620 family protein [Gordonia soli]|uniref:Uncharacterized protein n=1 Tax=Gordonia soli NBRC 108243 TaxID=1223545 RepID=M0QQ54_9ACTN|nr:hypothetical protein [Gordonia soli]GAC70713.1 hypothetical protein GS4_39_00440 [Gordonia soli NBRC 108243]
MKFWWQREIAEARVRADRMEQKADAARDRREEAERADARAQKVGDSLRKDLVKNGFAEAMRAAFGGVG